MKKWEINRRKVASVAVLLSIASIGIFAGTYAKYVSELSLANTNGDQNARVAVWDVGYNSSFTTPLFDKYYYGSDVAGSEDSGHSAPSNSSDTVFQNDTHTNNLVAPGTHGYKIIRLTNYASKGGTSDRGPTEVAFQVGVGTTNPNVAFTNSGSLPGKLEFAVINDPLLVSGTTALSGVTWSSTSTDGSSAVSYYDQATNLTFEKWQTASSTQSEFLEKDAVKFTTSGETTHDVVILWRWVFTTTEDETLSTDGSGGYHNAEAYMGKAETDALEKVTVTLGNLTVTQLD
ncbi:MAG: hypothetical protein LBS33_01655 [Streptococcaceae bacterium]|jgi:hypothetical protein|nr:hypothetical protein [Streptococcaceae bacterium]